MDTLESAFTDYLRDPVELLLNYHRQVRSLLSGFLQSHSSSTNNLLSDSELASLRVLAEKVEVHKHLEEKLVYPTFRSLADEAGRERIDQSLQQHQITDVLLKELMGLVDWKGEDGPKFSSPEVFFSKAKELNEALESHMTQEEQDFFPRFTQLLQSTYGVDGVKKTMEKLAEQMTQMKQQLELQLESVRDSGKEALLEVVEDKAAQTSGEPPTPSFPASLPHFLTTNPSPVSCTSILSTTQGPELGVTITGRADAPKAETGVSLAEHKGGGEEVQMLAVDDTKSLPDEEGGTVESEEEIEIDTEEGTEPEESKKPKKSKQKTKGGRKAKSKSSKGRSRKASPISKKVGEGVGEIQPEKAVKKARIR